MYLNPYRAVPQGIVDSLMSGTIGSWMSFRQFTVDYWWNAFARGSTPFDLAKDLVSWSAAMNNRERPPWAHENRVVREWPIARLRDFSAEDAPQGMVATVILPPQAGHDSSIVDFVEGQSQIITARDNGCSRVYALEWVGATQETKDTSIDDYMALLREVADGLGGKVNLVGDCQGGWLATIFTALYPERVNSLAIAGAPIDFHAGEPLIHDWVRALAPNGDMGYFRSAVESNDGVLPGRFLLDGFKALQPDQELSRRLDLLTNVRDARHVERYRVFENWFQWTQDLPGEFYLWVVEHLFLRNSLIKGELEVEGRLVDLGAIECPLFLMAGRTDHITPGDQVWALADYVSTPQERIGRQSATAGHLGLFMSHESLEKHWNVIFAEMGALSTPTLEDDPDVLTDEPTHSRPTRRGRRSPVVQDALPTSSEEQATPEPAAGNGSNGGSAPVSRTAGSRTSATRKAVAASSSAEDTVTVPAED